MAFLAPNFYSRHFNSHLAASSCILAGLGASRIWTAIHSVLPSRVRAFALALMLVSLAAPFARTSILDARSISATSVDIASSIRQTVPVEECFFAFEPQWSIAGGRLPMADLTGPVVVDSCATMLLDAMATGQRFPDADAAFQHPASQARVRARLETCRFVMLGYGGERELSAESKLGSDAALLDSTPSTTSTGSIFRNRCRAERPNKCQSLAPCGCSFPNSAKTSELDPRRPALHGVRRAENAGGAAVRCADSAPGLGFGPPRKPTLHERVIVTWGATPEAQALAEKHRVQLWDFRDLAPPDCRRQRGSTDLLHRRHCTDHSAVCDGRRGSFSRPRPNRQTCC